MEETKVASVDFVQDTTNKSKKEKFKAKCLRCKDKEKVVANNGIETELPFALVDVSKDKELIKEFKGYLKEAEGKYKDLRVIKRTLRNYCPKCGSDITVCCKDYVDFYSPKKKDTKVEE